MQLVGLNDIKVILREYIKKSSRIGAFLSSYDVNGQLASLAIEGTPPLVVNSTTVVPSLNASLLDGHPASDFVTTMDTVDSVVLETIDDRVANSLLQNTTAVTWTYDDAAGTLTPSITHAGLVGLDSDDHTLYARLDGHRAFSGDQTFNMDVSVLQSLTVGSFIMPAGAIDGYVLQTDNYGNANWQPNTSPAHGSLTGLAEDDHHQYLRTDGTRVCTGNQTFSADVTINDWLHIGYFKMPIGAVPGRVLGCDANGIGTWSELINTHAGLGGLTIDDHPQYAYLYGRIGGQVLAGGTAAGEDLTLQSTDNPIKGSILFGNSSYNEINNRLGIGTVTPAYLLDVIGDARVTGFHLPTGANNGYVLRCNSTGDASWDLVPSGVTDHGTLLGLSDDDHPQYALTSGSRNITGNQIFDQSISVAGSGVFVGDIRTAGSYYGDGSNLTGVSVISNHHDLLGLLDDDHTQYYLANGSRIITSNITASGVVGTTPLSGSGSRFMWIPSKNALRAGSVSDTEWDDANIGSNSVAFGENNIVSGQRGFNGAGIGNIVDGSCGVITGGSNNNLLSAYGFIGGGANNEAITGSYATIPGGRENSADGDYSFAAGRRAHAMRVGCFTWADSTDADFISTTPDEFAIRASGGFRVVGSGMFSGDVRTEGSFYGDGSKLTGITGSGSSSLVIDRFTAAGSASFTLSEDPLSENNTWVYMNGVYQQKDTYSIVGTTLTLDEIPPAGVIIEVVIISSISLVDESSYVKIDGSRNITGHQTFTDDISVTGSGVFGVAVRAPFFYGDGSGLTGISTGTTDHTTLTNLNSANYTHLTAANHTDLTDGGATTLHKHDHGNMDGLADDDHTQYLLADGSRSCSGNLIAVSGVFNGVQLTTGAGAGYVLKSSSTGIGSWIQQKIEIPISAAGLKGTTTAGAGDASSLPESIEIGPSGMNYDFMAFDGGATNENAFFTLSLPQGWDEGPITYRVKWTAAAGSGGDTVIWGLQGVCLSNDEAIGTAVYNAPIYVSDALITAEDVHITSDSDPMTIGGTPSQGDACYFKISRNSAVDSHTTDAKLMELILTFTRDNPTDV
jgi:hypothetical protein